MDDRKNEDGADPAQLLMNLMKAGQEAWLQAARASTTTPAAPGADPLSQFAALGMQFMQLQQSYLQQVNAAWLNLMGLGSAPSAAAAGEDRRFAAEAWRSDPGYEALSKAYLAYSGYLQGLAQNAPVDEKTRAQLQFSVRQFTDAMSPTNFLASNPEALQLARETGGRSLAEGLSLFFHDLAQGHLSMTDEQAFEVGRNVATTAGSVVFENELMQVIQYAAVTPQVHEVPLLIVPPCINKFYILDLQPSNSFVRHAVEQGHTVFLVSWRSVGSDVGHLTWDDYIDKGVLRALDVVLEITAAPRANALGFCIGGTLLASALAVDAARGRHRAASLTLLTTLLDFSQPGELGNLVSESSLEQREAAVGKGGIVQGRELALVFSALRANDLIWQYVVNSYLKGQKPPAFDLLYWNSDAANLPGPMFCWYLRNTYLANALRRPNGTVQGGVPVDLGALRMPAYVYASREDHIVPWLGAYASCSVLGGECTFVLGASGHIAGVVNPPEKKKRNYWVEGEAGTEAPRWLETARSEPGSWWTHWRRWLEGHAGGRISAPARAGSEKHPVIEPAPGRYVKARA